MKNIKKIAQETAPKDLTKEQKDLWVKAFVEGCNFCQERIQELFLGEDSEPSRKKFTCYKCDKKDTCRWAWDDFNLDGECLDEI